MGELAHVITNLLVPVVKRIHMVMRHQLRALRFHFEKLVLYNLYPVFDGAGVLLQLDIIAQVAHLLVKEVCHGMVSITYRIVEPVV